MNRTPLLVLLVLASCTAKEPSVTTTAGTATVDDLLSSSDDGPTRMVAYAEEASAAESESLPASALFAHPATRTAASVKKGQTAGVWPPAVAPGTPQPSGSAAGSYPSSRNTFTHHGVNPMTLVEDDARSTFSIDVDTASYALARRRLLGGHLPASASVRVEEFVNYFDYDYADPRNGPFAVDMEAMPDPFRPGHHILRVGVQGKDGPPKAP